MRILYKISEIQQGQLSEAFNREYVTEEDAQNYLIEMSAKHLEMRGRSFTIIKVIRL